MEFEIWTIDGKLCQIDVIVHLIFFLDLNTNHPRVYLSYILNFILIEHKRAEIQSSKVGKLTENHEDKIGITSLGP